MSFSLSRSTKNCFKGILYNFMRILKLESKIDTYFNFLNLTSKNYYAYRRFHFSKSALESQDIDGFQIRLRSHDSIDTTIVIQGPIVLNNSFTLNVIIKYLQDFSSAKIVLSTWKNQVPNEFRVLESLFSANARFLIIESELPSNPGISNINLQLESTQAGIRAVMSRPTQYLLKTRTDQCFFNKDTLKILQDLHEKNRKPSGKGRILAPSRGSFLLRPYGVTDMFTFGDFNSVLDYWSAPKDHRPVSTFLSSRGETLMEEARNEVGEIYVCKHYLRNLGYSLSNTVTQSLQIYRDEFLFFDTETIDLIWHKYTANLHKWEHLRYEFRHKEVTHFIWKDLQENMSNYEFLEKYSTQRGAF